MRRIVEYVAADRALGKAALADLVDGRYEEVDESPEYAAAHERVCVAEDKLTPAQNAIAEWISERVNQRLWVQIWDYEDELEKRGIWSGVMAGEHERPTDEAAFEYLWRNLVVAEMQHRGYTDEEIEVASRVPAHTGDCEFEMNDYSWNCSDEEGKSNHPIADEYDDIAGIIGRALEQIPEANR